MPRTPSDPTKAQVWIDQTGPELDFEFYIPAGSKGDPGGIAFGTDLGNASLDQIVVSGIYRQTNGTYVTAANNYPVVGGIGVLTVLSTMADNTRFEQTFDPIAQNEQGSGRVFYRRVYYAGTWYPWKAYTSQRVDQSAGRAIYAWDNLNNREQLVYGDTGWRDVKALTINGWSSTSLLIRRVGSAVSLVGSVSATAATSDHYMPLQAGFAPAAGGYHGVASSTAVPPVFRPLGTDGTNHYVTSGGTSGTYNIQANYMTVSSWPTTLPGTASGSIPNL